MGLWRRVISGFKTHGDKPLRRGSSRRRGYSATEAVISVGVATVLIGLMGVAVSKAQRAKYNTMCSGNLRNISLAFRQYATDNLGRLPAPAEMGIQWEDCLRRYIHRSTFQCPSDKELFATVGSSYDWRETGDPKTTLANRLITDVSHANTALTFEALPGWHEAGKVQMVTLEGQVLTVSQNTLIDDLMRAVRQ